MNAKPKRIWNFSLRTLFVVTTILCIWLGWELSVIRHRQSLRKEMEATQAYEFQTAQAWVAMYPPSGPNFGTIARVRFVRTLLGDEAIQTITYSYSANGEAERAKLAKVFPEAEIREILYEPCHPGCFPSGTVVQTPQGATLIEQLAVGDAILAIGLDGASTEARIDSIFKTDNRLWAIETDQGTLLTTSIQPLVLTSRRLKPAGELVPGDELLQYVDGALRPAMVKQVTRTERVEQVFNVVLVDADHFVAGGYVARCKPPALAVPTTSHHEHE